jgi:hypothetical protein
MAAGLLMNPRFSASGRPSGPCTTWMRGVTRSSLYCSMEIGLCASCAGATSALAPSSTAHKAIPFHVGPGFPFEVAITPAFPLRRSVIC